MDHFLLNVGEIIINKTEVLAPSWSYTLVAEFTHMGPRVGTLMQAMTLSSLTTSSLGQMRVLSAVAVKLVLLPLEWILWKSQSDFQNGKVHSNLTSQFLKIVSLPLSVSLKYTLSYVTLTPVSVNCGIFKALLKEVKYQYATLKTQVKFVTS